MVFSTVSRLAAALAIVSQLVSCAPTDDTMIQALNSHNNYRARHHVGGVNWSQDLANHALGLSQSCVFGHVVVSIHLRKKNLTKKIVYRCQVRVKT